ncbi:putative rhomboid family membrane protein [Daldinia childiae]|nr:putative rhomboid family membrane protein [Daldinia childiae]KAF3068928.1 putative rhomboid family membrane protein [Daldinia childiae]
MSGAELPEKAKEMQARLRAERARRAQDGLTDEQKRMLEEHRRKGEKGLLERVWMGDSGEDWKAKRDQREKEALGEGGGGYWSLIADQVSEVWNQGKKKKDGDEEKEKESESKKP